MYAKSSTFNPIKTTDVKMIFDTGTYVTNDVDSHLHLPTLRTERIFLNTFVYCDSKPRTVDVVPGKFIVNGKLIVTEALFATQICSDITWPTCQKCF